MVVTMLRNYPAVVTSEMVVQRLRELHYEKYFVNQRLPTASTFAFKQASTMDQLLAFASLCKVLIERLGSSLQAFSEFDEPNAIAMEVINACKPFVNCEGLAPHELRQGSGDAVCALLLALSEAVLEKIKLQDIVWKESADVKNANHEENDEEDDDDLMDDAYMASFEAGGTSANAFGISGGKSELQEEIAPGVLDVHRWQEEELWAEEALNVTKINNYVQDWRPDIEKLMTLATKLSAESQGITEELAVVSDGIGKQLERLVQREQFLNEEISSFSGKLIEVSRTHEGLTKESDEIQSEISILNEELAEITEKFKQLKAEMTSENTRITDTSGLTSAKNAIGMLSNEIRDLDLRIILAQQRLFGAPNQ